MKPRTALFLALLRDHCNEHTGVSVARTLGVTPEQVSRWLSGARLPNASRTLEILALLGQRRREAIFSQRSETSTSKQ